MQFFVYCFAMIPPAKGALQSMINQVTLLLQPPTIFGGACARTGVGPYAAWMPRKSLHGRTCGVSHAGTRASALSDRGICAKPADVCVGLVDAAPRSHASRLLIGKQCILKKRSNHQQPKTKTASRSLRRPSDLHRLADDSATPPRPSCRQPRHAGADATGGWPHPATPARWLR
ncbi:hypothetical protein XhhCFBP4925_04555 [Xanthomonas hortorum pv. hederae]|nr:hypothetical protein XhhCFBP4925_04555 [Xanthomonas hortorum pv. hederae]PUF01188.1 hypothetical protein C7T87_04460 [Xanthomonas hortorum pv. hederae]